MLMIALLAAAAWVAGCKQRGPTTGPAKANAPAHPPDKEWTAEEIAANTEGYMKWAQDRIDRQILDRKDRLAKLQDRLGQVNKARQTLDEKMRNVENIRKRMQSAYQRAEDEDRFPFEMGGRSFDQATARKILDETGRFLADRQPLSEAYDQAVAKLDAADTALREDVDKLNRLRERMALDLERVRLNQGVEELATLRKNEAEIAGFAKTLGAMADESLATSLPTVKEPKIDVEGLLNK